MSVIFISVFLLLLLFAVTVCHRVIISIGTVRAKIDEPRYHHVTLAIHAETQ